MYADWTDVEQIILSVVLKSTYDEWVVNLAHAGVTPDQHWMQLIGPVVDDAINQFCGRTFDTVAETRSYYGNNTPIVFPGCYPVQSATLVKIKVLATLDYYSFNQFRYVNQHDREGRVLSTAATASIPQIEIDCAKGTFAILPAAFPIEGPGFFWPWMTFVNAGGWWENVDISFTHGYTDANRPSAVRGAAAAMAAGQIVQALGAMETGGVTSWRLGPESRGWAAPSAGPVLELVGFLVGGPYAAAINPRIAMAVDALSRHRTVEFL